MTWLNQLARPEIIALRPYEHASWGPGLERLHANELPWRSLSDESEPGLHRYPEPQPRGLIERLAGLYDVPRESILLGRGSDEAIDVLVRAFCRAGTDRVIVCPPTFGMYSVAARIQGAEVTEVPLRSEQGFRLDTEAILRSTLASDGEPRTCAKLVFLCSPNNPTGNLLDSGAILDLTRALQGRCVVAVDEAYLEFSGASSLASDIGELPHLVVLRTLSKAYALAGARCGALIASPDVINLTRKLLPPYTIPQPSLEAALKALEPSQVAVAKARWEVIRAERQRVHRQLESLAGVARVWPSAANFLLVEFVDADYALQRARAAGLLIRSLRTPPSVSRCLRITIGTEAQNNRLLEALA